MVAVHSINVTPPGDLETFHSTAHTSNYIAAVTYILQSLLTYSFLILSVKLALLFHFCSLEK
jgi:hypothetical protein